MDVFKGLLLISFLSLPVASYQLLVAKPKLLKINN